MALGPGSRLDAYEIVRLLGAGGMAEVWLATEVRLGRRVALKILPAELTSDPARVQRFEQEARAASALSHPNVCHIYALGETGDGQHYIAMEYVDGETLRQRLSGTRLSVREALDIAIQIAAALTAAHASGIVHRDIKPENVMLRLDGFVKVLDFGLAKLAPAAPDVAGADTTQTVLKTEAGVVVGTAAYMSPEQARGQEVDARTDIWSLAVMLYEMVAGRSPFAGPSGTDVLAAILERQPAPLARFDPETPPELQRIVTKCLRKEPALRYQVVQDLLLDLEVLRDDVRAQTRSASGPAPVASVTATEPGAVASSRMAASATPWSRVVLAAIATVVIAGVTVGVWWWRSRPTEPAAAASTGRGTVSGVAAPVERTLTRLTSLPGLQTDVTFSPDGRFIAYASDHGGNFDIWVQPVAGGGEPVQVTKSPYADTEPDWSPDGSQIVFRSERDGGGLFIVPALGGPERRLAPFGMRAKWSPDGSRVLFSSAPPGLTSGPMFVVGTDGSPPHRVLQQFTDAANGITSWAWHPDGRRISLLAEAVGANDFATDRALYTVSPDGGAPIVTTLPESLRGGANTVGEFAWAPAGDALYVEHSVNRIWNVWRLGIDPRTLQAGPLVRLTAGTGQDIGLAVARDGKEVAFTTKAESIRLWVYPLDPVAGRVAGRGEPITDALAAVPSTAALAPDGRRIAYSISAVGSGRWELWTADLASGDKRLLARDDRIRWDAKWSRDGNRLVYQWVRSLDRTGSTANARQTVFEASLALRDVNGADETLLSTPVEQLVQPHDWSPDGQSILVSWMKPGKRAVLAIWPVTAAPHADGSALVVTEDPEGGLWQGRYSPSGQWISFLTSRPGRAIVCVVPATARRMPVSGWTCVSDPEGWTDKPRWSADGKLLYVWRKQGALFNVWASRFDDMRGTIIGAPFQVTHFDSPAHRIWADNLGASEPSVARTRMTLPIADASGSIWMLDNVDK
jgi:eukaryotic-like serine/threonine-protein kinase